MQTKLLQLATSFQELDDKFSKFRSKDSWEQAINFVPDPTDIFITPLGKAGTTWTQQIVHTLRTRGDMDFDEIMEVTPWLELAYDLGVDLHAPQKAHPRAFKSHMKWDDIPKGARYIYPVRDPRDVVVSMYNFIGDWMFEKDAISIEDFARRDMIDRQGYWDHINSWWTQRDNPDVLFLIFEDMKRDLPTTIRMIADFMHIELDDELLEITKKHASFEFMKAHQRQFDDHLISDNFNEKLELPPNVGSSKVKNGRVGDHKKALSSEIIDSIEAGWGKYTRPEDGLESYSHLQNKIREVNKKCFSHLML